jgi:SAM-dependent methyltransferase
MSKPSVFSDSDIDAIKVSSRENYFIPVLRQVLDRISHPTKICDVGCGNGVFTACFKEWFTCYLCGVDGSPYALEQAAKLKFDELHLIKDFSSENLPFLNNSFDLLINKDVLEHLIHPEMLVKEMVRITKPGGHLLIHVPNHFPIFGRLKLLFQNTIDPFGYFPMANRWNFPHIRFFNSADFIKLMIINGLSPTVCLSHNFPSFPKVGRLIPNTIKNYLSRNHPDVFAEGYTWLFQK